MEIKYECPDCPSSFPFFWQFHMHTSEGCEIARVRDEFDSITKGLNL